MKWFFLIAVAAVSLSACTGGPLSVVSPNCAEGICIKLQVVEPVRFNQPVVVAITVTSEKDMPNLGITLYTDDPEVSVEGPRGWETNARDGRVWRSSAGWTFAAKADTPVRFTRVLRFPAREANVSVHATFHAPPRSYVATDSVQVVLTRAGGTVYLRGTPVPGAGPKPTMAFSPRLNAKGTPILTPTLTGSMRPPPALTPFATPTRRPYP